MNLNQQAECSLANFKHIIKKKKTSTLHSTKNMLLGIDSEWKQTMTNVKLLYYVHILQNYLRVWSIVENEY